MTAIQALLTAAIGLLMVLYVKSFRNQASKRMFFLLFFAVGVVFVLLPGLTNELAHFLGIGRGADLLLYFGIIGGFLILLLIYAKFKRLDRTVSELVRRQALLNAKKPEDDG